MNLYSTLPGILHYPRKSKPDVTPPIVDIELFNQANEVLKRQKELKKGRPKNQYLLTGHIVCGKCGKPLSGTYTRPPYRYYLCSETYRREYKEKSCDALRIRGAGIENIVWQKVKEALENPDILMAQIKAIVEAEHDQDNEGILEKDITKLKRKIKAYHVDERELLSLFRHKEIDRDCLLDEINQVKKEREQDEQRLVELTRNKEVLSDMRDMELQLTEYCQTVAMNLSNCDFETKRLALKALGIKVTANSGNIDIQGTIPIEIKSTNLAMSANATSWG